MGKEIEVHHIGPVDGNRFRMKGARSYWRLKPVTCVKMALPFVVTRDGKLENGVAGDYLCDQDGIRWVVPGAAFEFIFTANGPGK